MIDVVAALVEREGRFLLCRRPEGKACALKWELAGGKVEPGETHAQALAREWREELGVELSVGEQIADVEQANPGVTVRLWVYRARIISGDPTPREHAELRWVTPHERAQYDLCPADRVVLDAIFGGEPAC